MLRLASSLEDDGRPGQSQPGPNPDRQHQGRDGAEDADQDGRRGDVRRREDEGDDSDRDPHGKHDQQHEQADADHGWHPCYLPCLADCDLVTEQAAAKRPGQHACQYPLEHEEQRELQQRKRNEGREELSVDVSKLRRGRLGRQARQRVRSIEFPPRDERAGDAVDRLDDGCQAESGDRVAADQRERAVQDIADSQRP